MQIQLEDSTELRKYEGSSGKIDLGPSLLEVRVSEDSSYRE